MYLGMSLLSRSTTTRRLFDGRSFHTSSTCRASILFALGALSNSRETAHFNKISKLPRYEHSPPLKIIKTSEVDAYPCPTPSRPAAAPEAWTASRTASALRVWDDKALQIGRVILANEARRSRRLRYAFTNIKRKQAVQDAIVKRERLSWHKEKIKLENDMRVAVRWILASIGAATAIAAWKFFPGVATPRNGSDMGRSIAAKASAAMPLPAVAVPDPGITSSATSPPATTIAVKESLPATLTSAGDTAGSHNGGWFWRQ